MREIAVIIPVFNPEPELASLCAKLLHKYDTILIVDDGSNEHVEDFAKLPAGVQIVHHAINRGKGRAIKTGIEWVNIHRPDVKVVVFVDGDGQHRPEDVEKVAAHAAETDCVTLGVRDFSRSGIPFPSRFGNVLTSFLVRRIFKIKIHDTQTGLRAIPRRLFDAMLETTGERYEYEMRLFGMLRARTESLEQVPIQTIYTESNRASHFKPIVDSIRVYRALFGGTFVRFCLSSLLGFLTDNAVFTLLLLSLHPIGLLRRYEIFISLVSARIVSATINYLCNRLIVFNWTATAHVASFLRYWVLAALIALLSYAGTTVLSYLADAHGVAVTILKITVETGLFLLSYHVQKRWVFAQKLRMAEHIDGRIINP